MAHRRIERREGAYTLAWDGAGEALYVPLWPLVAWGSMKGGGNEAKARRQCQRTRG